MADRTDLVSKAGVKVSVTNDRVDDFLARGYTKPKRRKDKDSE